MAKQRPQEAPQATTPPGSTWNGAAHLVPLLVPLDSLTLDPRNANSHPERNLRAIRASLDRFGQQKNIVADRDRVVRAGNGALLVAREMGWSHIACTVFDGSADEARAFAIADNRSAELSEWNLPVLADELKHLEVLAGYDLEAFGWDDFELDAVLGGRYTPPATTPLPEGQESTHTPVIKVTHDQRRPFELVCAWVRATLEQPELLEGECLARACHLLLRLTQETPGLRP